MTNEAQIQEHHDWQNEKLSKQILALPDEVVISYDFQGKHYAYTAEYVKRVVGEWKSMKDRLDGKIDCSECGHIHYFGDCQGM